jgi:hypothetical protein
MYISIYIYVYIYVYFTGIIGDSNTVCFTPASSTNGAVGAKCTANNDCLYNICTDNICGVTALACPTNVPGKCNICNYVLYIRIWTYS